VQAIGLVRETLAFSETQNSKPHDRNNSPCSDEEVSESDELRRKTREKWLQPTGGCFWRICSAISDV
jgi:hypothetical protein